MWYAHPNSGYQGKNLPVMECEFEGRMCLHRYIETRVLQPACTNCLREMNILHIFPVIELETIEN